MGTREDVIAFMTAFPGEDEGDLRALDRMLVDACSLPQDDEVDAAILGIFERYPDEEGAGVYWSIVHGLEHRGNYESSLVASVRRAPSGFGALMLNRLKNAGSDVCAGESILELLAEISESPAATAQTRRSALDFIDDQRKRSSES